MNRYKTEGEVKGVPIGEVFYVEKPFISGENWGVQFPRGRIFYRTKRVAKEIAFKVREMERGR